MKTNSIGTIFKAAAASVFLAASSHAQVITKPIPHDSLTISTKALSSNLEVAKSRLKIVKGSSKSIQKEFILQQDEAGNSKLGLALINKQPDVAKEFIEIAQGLSKNTQKEFVALKNKAGLSQFKLAADNEQPEIAIDLLNMAFDVNPKAALETDIPKNVSQNKYFLQFAKKVATSEKISEDKKMFFLSKNDNEQGTLFNLYETLKAKQAKK
jgi:hypothetical protein